MRIIVLFNLKPGISVADYEEWVLTRDMPGVRSLPSIDTFRVFRATGLLGGGSGAAPYQYIEVLDIVDLEGFAKDTAGAVSQQLARELLDYVDKPLFITTAELD